MKRISESKWQWVGHVARQNHDLDTASNKLAIKTPEKVARPYQTDCGEKMVSNSTKQNRMGSSDERGLRSGVDKGGLKKKKLINFFLFLQDKFV